MLVLTFLFAINTQADKIADVDPQKFINDMPSLVGYADNEFIIVLKDEIKVDHVKDSRAPIALLDKQGFDGLAKRFDVISLKPQFNGSDKKISVEGQALSRYYKVQIGYGDIDVAIRAFENNPMVAKVEKIGIHFVSLEANDTYYRDLNNPNFQFNQWHYWDTYGVAANTAWNTTTGDATVVVGVLDSGVKYLHSDLGGSNPPGPNDNSTNGNIFINGGEIPGDGIDNDGNGYVDDVIGYDFVASGSIYAGVSCTDADCSGIDNDPSDWNGHGTHVAGTIAAITNNGNRVAGVAGGFADGTPTGTANGVKLVPCRVGFNGKYRGVDGYGFVIMSAVAEAMYYMGNLKASGVNVAAVNCSFGNSNSGGLGAAVNFLLAQDVMIIVAAGNANNTSQSYLGSRNDCMDVGATDKSGNPASFSTYGSWVDIAAPGVEILSTYFHNPDPAGDYIAVLSGTSMSAPHVVGVAALLESADSSLSATDKWNLMVSTSSPYNPTKDVGAGIVNARNALDAIGPQTPTANFSASPTSGVAPLAVNFTDLSSGSPTSWSWIFGDGGISTAQNPNYSYTTAGTYSVSLSVSNAQGSDAITKTGYIIVSAPNTDPPIADFSGSPTSGDAPLIASFSDLSTNSPTSWSWTFGDGGTSIAQNPDYTYTSAGVYSVSMTATNAYGSDVVMKVDYVTVTQPTVNVMHVHDIVVTRESRGPNWNGAGVITIYDQNEQPVANASVSVTATGTTGGTGTFATGSDGKTGKITTRKTRNPVGEWCYEVTNVTHASNTYNSGANHVTKACESGPVFKSGNPREESVLPDEFALLQNYPNPFNPSTIIGFKVPNAAYVSLEIYNINGQKVISLVNKTVNSGYMEVDWDASKSPSGVYLYRLVADGLVVDKKKMLLLK